MPIKRRSAERQVSLFLLGVVLLAPPVLLAFDKPLRVAGIPMLYFYLFAAWAVLIGLTAALSERIVDDGIGGREAEPAPAPAPGEAPQRPGAEPATDA
jgi:hypothetical protein